MKRISLVLAVMFLVFDYSWAEKKVAVKLNVDHANSFLVHKRDWCSVVQITAETKREIDYPGTDTIDVHEECCDEGCNTEEMTENQYGSEIGNFKYEFAEEDREVYMESCC